MTTRVPGGGVARNPFGPTWVGGKAPADSADAAGSVGEQVQDSLFGRRKPEILPEDVESARLLARLHTFRKKLARLAGDPPEDYDLCLAAGTIAAIDGEGLIYVGRELLFDHAGDLEVQVGVLAHEIGHRPKRWAAYRAERPLDRAALEDLCRLEETRADYFAGFALAQLKMSAEPLCAFLAALQQHPHPEYLSAELRVKTIREGAAAGTRRQRNLRKFFPELARMSSADGDLGSG